MTEPVQICQVARVNVHLLTCPSREGGGYQCERLDPHDDTDHMVGDHTIRHVKWGNGYAC